jgi:uncharacterized protein YuzE
MKIKYFKDTDTLYIELRRDAVVETKDLDENTQIDLDRGGKMPTFMVVFPWYGFSPVGVLRH